MIAIIDGDVLCYQACPDRWSANSKTDGERILVELDEDGNKKPPEFTEEEDRKYLELAWEEFQRLLDELLEKVFADDFVMAVADSNRERNFRKILYPMYKMNRHNNPKNKNIFVPHIRELAIGTGLAVEALGREADDLVRIWANESREAQKNHIVCSIDKDLKCIPGMHYRMYEKKIIEITEEEALRNYYEQLLKGDSGDNIVGVPGIGDVKARRILAPYNTEEDFQERVIEYYVALYQDKWAEELLLNGKMIHIQNHINDYFNFDRWPLAKELIGESTELGNLDGIQREDS